MNMPHNTLRVDDAAGVRTIYLNRPKARNALNYDVLADLEHVLGDSQHNAEVRVVILRGEGQGFCAGDDLKGMGTDEQPIPAVAARRAELGYPRVISALRSLDKPVIAHLHGFALGAGCDLALACDLVFANSDTKFGLVFAQRGMVAGTVLLPLSVSYQQACETLFSGAEFSAERALSLGLINGIGEPEEVAEQVQGWAQHFVTAPTGAIGSIKRALNDSIGQSLETRVAVQRYAIALSYHSQDYNEGRTAFNEKRPPRFTGE